MFFTSFHNFLFCLHNSDEISEKHSRLWEKVKVFTKPTKTEPDWNYWAHHQTVEEESHFHWHQHQIADLEVLLFLQLTFTPLCFLSNHLCPNHCICSVQYISSIRSTVSVLLVFCRRRFFMAGNHPVSQDSAGTTVSWTTYSWTLLGSLNWYHAVPLFATRGRRISINAESPSVLLTVLHSHWEDTFKSVTYKEIISIFEPGFHLHIGHTLCPHTTSRSPVWASHLYS